MEEEDVAEKEVEDDDVEDDDVKEEEDDDIEHDDDVEDDEVYRVMMLKMMRCRVMMLKMLSWRRMILRMTMSRGRKRMMWRMMMLRGRKRMILRMLMWRIRTDPKTALRVLCEPAQSKCKSTFHKSHLVRKFKGKMPRPRLSPERGHTLCASLRGQNALQHFTRAT